MNEEIALSPSKGLIKNEILSLDTEFNLYQIAEQFTLDDQDHIAAFCDSTELKFNFTGDSDHG
jgi:hypothetical protein